MNFQGQANRATSTDGSYDTKALRHQSTRVLIQQQGSQRYLSADGGWGHDVEQAVSFRSGSAAVEQVVKRKLTKVQLVLIRDIRVSETIPVSACIRG